MRVSTNVDDQGWGPHVKQVKCILFNDVPIPQHWVITADDQTGEMVIIATDVWGRPRVSTENPALYELVTKRGRVDICMTLH